MPNDTPIPQTTQKQIIDALIAEVRRRRAARTPEQVAADKARDDREYRKWFREERRADRIANGY